MPIKKTDAEFKKEVYDLVKDEYTFLDHYVNVRTKIRVKHNKCGNIYEVKPMYFVNLSSRCPYCSSNAKKTDAQFKQEVINLVGTEYTFLDTYQGANNKIKVKHNKCGNIYSIKPSHFLDGTRCPYCNGNAKKTDGWFKREVTNLVGDEYTFLDSYVNAHTKLRVKHNKCGNTYEVRPHDFLSHNTRCPYCSGCMKKTDKGFKQEILDLVGTEYTFLDQYQGALTKIRVKHSRCGHTYKVAPYHFIEGHRCPYCTNSKGEDIINKILKLLGIKYEYQKAFDDLRDINLLSYDFYIPSQNILIEYQGIQHYGPVDIFGGDDRFAIQQKHDKMKSDYAKDHGYTLIAVPYTIDTFSEIKKYLLQHGLTK